MCLVPGPGLRNPERDLTYRVVPRAIQDYDDSYVTTIAENIDLTEKVIEVADASQLSLQHTSRLVKKRCISRKSVVIN